MNHKQIIILIVIIVVSVILIVVASVLIAAAVYGKKLNVHTSTDLNGINSEMQNILYYASIVPNSHNTQLWNVKLYPDTNKGKLEICYDEKRILNVVDPNKREAFISLGHYIEMLNILFQTYGYKTSISYQKMNEKENDISSPLCLIEYSLDKSSNSSMNDVNNIIKLIEKRHTNKGSFKKDQMKKEHVDLLKSKFGDNIQIFSYGDTKFNYIKDKTIDSIKSQSSNQNYRDELAEWLRFSNKESNKKLDGINADMMGFSGLKKGFYYMTIGRKSAKGNKFAKQGISTAKNQVKNCGSFILVTKNINNDGIGSIAQTIEVGRLSQRIWLECTQNDISLHPISAILEIEPFKSQIQNDLQLNEQVQIILRAGYCKKYGSNIKLRRNLKEYIEVVN